jgi:hypothetical protein
MNDGLEIELAVNSFRELYENYGQLRDALRNVPIKYAVSGFDTCGPKMREVLSHPPGIGVHQ